MMYSHLHYSSKEGVATLTLNRPEVYNALNDTLTYELQDAFKKVGQDDNIRVVVLTGEGKAFCSGQDLKNMEGLSHSVRESLKQRYNPLILAMRQLPKPILCKLNGVAAGAGCSLALACDMIIAAEEASLAQVFVGIGLVPDAGSSFFLPRIAPANKVFEWCSMGTPIKATEALQFGLVNQVVSLSELNVETEKYVQYFKKAPTRAIGLMKKMFNRSTQSTLEEMLDYEAYCQEIASKTLDFQEGVKAFLQKRKPAFEGR